jgi:membrane protease YdiL (CAAX protease family)
LFKDKLSLESLESIPKNIPDPKVTLKICGIIAGVFIVLLMVIPYLFPHFSIILDNFTFLPELLIIFFLFKLISKSGYNLRNTLYLNKIQKNIIAPILVISASVNIFEAGFITYLQHFTNWPTFGNALAPELSPFWYYNIFLIIGACITAPIWEELLFRGLILSSFSERFGPATAIIVSSLAFSSLHFVPSVVIGLFVSYIMAGWIVYKTKSVISGILIHGLGNIVAMVGAIIIGNDNMKMINDLTRLNDFVLYAAYLLIGSIGAVAGIVWLNRKINPSEISLRPG